MANRLLAWWNAHKPTRRRLIQIYAALLYNAHIKGYIRGEIYTGRIKNVCMPGLNCYSCPGAVGACPLGALQNALASSGVRAPWFVLGILMLYGLILGRTICGWICPFGLLQELVWKLPTLKLKKNRLTRVLSWLKYVVLGLFVLILPLMYASQDFPVPGFCKYICPAGTLEGALSLLSHPVNTSAFSLLGIVFTRKFILLVLIAAVCIFAYRAFCRFLCPLGAIYGLFARLSLLGVKVDAPNCTNCGRCVAECKMDVRQVGDHECIHCGECIGICPSNAISWKFGSVSLVPGNASASDTIRKTRNLRSAAGWSCALAVLAVILWSVNSSDALSGSSISAVSTVEESVPIGKDIGMKCPDFTLPYLAEEGVFRLSDEYGRPIVINFWATWCTPCVAELPYFQQIVDAYGDRITVLAIHSVLVTDDVSAYLRKEGYTFSFAQDVSPSGSLTGADTVLASLGGSTMLPMTVILDADGRIVYNQIGSVTSELLDNLIAPLLE